MSRAPSTFRQNDVKRALLAVEAAGKKATSVEIEPGRIKIGLNGTDNNDTCGSATNETSEWDEKYGKH